jgi:predicted nuclease of predicted toxin-antitoxin system
VRFLIDMPLSPALVSWLSDRGHDAAHAVDLGLSRATDGDIIERARRERERSSPPTWAIRACSQLSAKASRV